MKVNMKELSGYAAERFAEDVTAMLPFALPEFQKSGRMLTCAHCGTEHHGICFAVQKCTALDSIADVEIVSLCDVCATKPALLAPEKWAHVGAASGLFVAQKDWATFATGLRCLGALALREKFGWPLVAKLLHADGPLRDACNAVIFCDGTSSGRVREAPFVFPWESDKSVFAVGGRIKLALEAALCYGYVMPYGKFFAYPPKPEEAT